MSAVTTSNSDRLQELGNAKVWRLLLKYSLPAVVGTVVMAVYNIIDSIVIGHAIDDPNVVSGIAVTFPVMNLATALGMLIGAGASTRISIVMGQDNKRMAEVILGNSVQLTVIIGITYMTLFALFLTPILKMFGASENSLPYAREFLMWVLPGMVLMNLTFSYNNVMRATGYPEKAMYTNLIGAGLNAILAPLFLFGFHWGIKGAAIATDISMIVTSFFVMSHFFQKKSVLHFKRGTFALNWHVIKSILYIGMAPFMINVAGSAINAIVNNSLLQYGGDNAIASVVVFNRFVTIFVMIVIGICQGMQPILGYNYGSGRIDRLFRTLWLAAGSGLCITTIGSLLGAFNPQAIASMFMQDSEQIECAVNCLRITTIGFWMVGFQIVGTNFFQSLGMAGKAVFLSLTRQIIFMIPMLLILPPHFGLDGVWGCYPVCDMVATTVTCIMLAVQLKKIKKRETESICMRIDFTPLVRGSFIKLAERTDSWATESSRMQIEVLRGLLSRGGGCEYLRKYVVTDLKRASDSLYERFVARVPLVEYETIRPYVMRMIKGDKDVLWRGVCHDYAQSSGTSGGRSKFIPVTSDSLKGNHYRGGADVVAHYLRLVPESKIFAGKGFILGGSFANTLGINDSKVHIGDLSATLINKINPLANLVRVPDKKTALLADWEEKLPALVAKASVADVTNISGVPSWFMTVIRRIMEDRGVDSISEVWPNLEVFFHGGISFEPYREEYMRITDPVKMHFQETYNASEGFFAVQNDFSDKSMLLLIDSDVFYEFIPIDEPDTTPRPIWGVEAGKVYELVITSSNGLWRYRLGDTVRVVSTSPVKIRIAGRTHGFINAFGEELMEDNAERAIASACAICGASIMNYTAAPLFATEGRRGRHQWLIEWERVPADMSLFSRTLDEELRKLNSDYDAKRSHTIFLDAPEVISAPSGLFDRWLKEAGSHKLGGQRKVARLNNNRDMIVRLLEMVRFAQGNK